LIPSDGPINVDEIFYSRYANNPLFKDFPYREELYRNRINSLRGGIVKLKKWADFDKKAIKADRLLHSRRSHNVRGEPRWDGSDAQAYLKIDMTADKLAEMIQDALWKSRPAYQLFQFVVFRKHIDQHTQSKKKHKNPRQRKKGHYGDKKLSEMQPSDTSGTLPEILRTRKEKFDWIFKVLELPKLRVPLDHALSVPMLYIALHYYTLK